MRRKNSVPPLYLQQLSSLASTPHDLYTSSVTVDNGTLHLAELSLPGVLRRGGSGAAALSGVLRCHRARSATRLADMRSLSARKRRDKTRLLASFYDAEI
mmetsp:Transcript_25243/g.47215  ORF Transcript_25243/g.47215 Transcript_25243/m.47215 type:complete len:100 (+) Transcript_25243:2306-2605(+)